MRAREPGQASLKRTANVDHEMRGFTSMNFFQMHLIEDITKFFIKKGEEQGTETTDSGRVEQAPIYKVFAWISLIIGLATAIPCIFLAHEIAIGIFLLLLFSGLSVPVLISYVTCWITFNEEGFTRSTFFGRRYRYRYWDVVGMGVDASVISIEMNDGKRINLNSSWVNRRIFLKKVIDNCDGKHLKRIQPSVTDFSPSDFAVSYDSGVLGKALLVPKRKECQANYRKMKRIHIVIAIVVCACILCMFPAMRGGFTWREKMIFVTPWVICHLCLIVSMVLYYRYPDYFTIREKPEDGCERVKNHKLSTQVWAVASCIFCNMEGMCLLLGENAVFTDDSFHTTYICGAIAIGAVCTAIYIWIIRFFKMHSWEYRNYRLGYVSCIIWYLLEMLSLALALIIPVLCMA